MLEKIKEKIQRRIISMTLKTGQLPIHTVNSTEEILPLNLTF